MKSLSISFKITVAFLLSFLVGCPGIGEPTGDSTLTIVNNSSLTIDGFVDFTKVLIDDEKPFDEESFTTIKPYKSRKFHEWWLESFKDTPVQYMFLFDVQVLDTVPWNTIRKYEMYLTRIELTKEKLDSLDWVITYP